MDPDGVADILSRARKVQSVRGKADGLLIDTSYCFPIFTPLILGTNWFHSHLRGGFFSLYRGKKEGRNALVLSECHQVLRLAR